MSTPSTADDMPPLEQSMAKFHEFFLNNIWDADISDETQDLLKENPEKLVSNCFERLIDENKATLNSVVDTRTSLEDSRIELEKAEQAQANIKEQIEKKWKILDDKKKIAIELAEKNKALQIETSLLAFQKEVMENERKKLGGYSESLYKVNDLTKKHFTQLMDFYEKRYRAIRDCGKQLNDNEIVKQCDALLKLIAALKTEKGK